MNYKNNDSFIEDKIALNTNEVIDLSKIDDFVDTLSKYDIPTTDKNKVSPISLYFKNIAQYKLLTHEEEKDLFIKMSSSDKKDSNKARNDLILHNLKLVVFFAKRYSGKSKLEFDDLIQEGNLGLITAVENFDVTKGFKFSTYASWWIKQAITKAIHSTNFLVRLPENAVGKLNKIKRYYEENGLDYLTLTEKIIKDCCKQEKISVSDFKRIFPYLNSPISLNTLLSDDESTELLDLVPDTTSETPEMFINRLCDEESMQKIISKVDSLTDKEQYIIKHRFGLQNETPKTLRSLGKEFKLSGERIRKIESRSLRKIRKSISLSDIKNLL